MNKRKMFIERIPFLMDLPTEPLPGLPLVELVGEHRVLVENHCGVIGYGCNEIRVKVSYGQLCICGSDLRLACMTKHQLVITGQIDTVNLIRGSK